MFFFARKGLLFVISAPAGTGKTTLAQMLTKDDPTIVESISYTTRAPRPNEVAGEHYYFLSPAEFEAKIAAGEFLEYVKLYGQYYGTSASWIAVHQAAGRHVLLVIDTQGALQLKERCEAGECEAVFIFIAPPSLEALRTRLVARSTESEEQQRRRLDWAAQELQQIVHYDYCIVNDTLTKALEVLRAIVIAEEHRVDVASR